MGRRTQSGSPAPTAGTVAWTVTCCFAGSALMGSCAQKLQMDTETRYSHVEHRQLDPKASPIDLFKLELKMEKAFVNSLVWILDWQRPFLFWPRKANKAWYDENYMISNLILLPGLFWVFEKLNVISNFSPLAVCHSHPQNFKNRYSQALSRARLAELEFL